MKDRHQTLVHSELGVHSTNPIRHDSHSQETCDSNSIQKVKGSEDMRCVSHGECESEGKTGKRVKEGKSDKDDVGGLFPGVHRVV